MIDIRYTYVCTGRLPDGRHIVHLYVKQTEPTWTEAPNLERKAMLDAAQIVKDLVEVNLKDTSKPEERLLQGGDPPEGAKPIFTYGLGVMWNKVQRMPHYVKLDYERLDWDPIWQPVAEVGMEQRDYTYGVLHAREKEELRKWQRDREARIAK